MKDGREWGSGFQQSEGKRGKVEVKGARLYTLLSKHTESKTKLLVPDTDTSLPLTSAPGVTMPQFPTHTQATSPEKASR